jgi:hypothetical protein
MNRLRRALTAVLLLMYLPTAFAHSFPVSIEVSLRGRVLTAITSDPDGQPVIGTFRVQLLGVSGVLEETTLETIRAGHFTATLPALPPGQYTLRITDVTYPNETVDAATSLNVPLNASLHLTIPAYTQRQPPLLIWALILTPVVVVFIALVVVLLSPRPRTDTSSEFG